LTTLRGKRRPAVWLAGAAAALVALVLVVVLVFARGSSDPYQVRGIFDDAANLTPGEQVKVAGVPVGSVESVTPTPQAKAAVVMTISNPGFQDFRSDASCLIRPQSLLGEKYVDCQLTQPRAEGAPLPPPLTVIPSGQEGEGERYLPVQNTSSPVDPDLLTDINQLPESERLRIILNELGAGFAGRGEDLHEVILRANPALRETNRVLAILANENHILSKLSVDSDRALAPLAAVRKRVANYLVQSNVVASASARHETALSRNLADFPPFLEQLGPAMERIGKFADETTPVFTELGLDAPALNRVFTQLPAFSSVNTTYFKSLGKFAQAGGPALQASEPLLNRLETLGAAIKPFGNNFSSLLSSIRSTGGIERLMDLIFLSTGASNGYDALGHFLRADLTANALCSVYHVEREQGGTCPATFSHEESASAARASTVQRTRAAAVSASVAAGRSNPDALLQQTLAVLQGHNPPARSAVSTTLLNYLLGE
jgi:phospholipid/cholesterol/gamma-HCH transport system substrate-binding protein